MLDLEVIKQRMDEQGRNRKWLARQIGIELGSLNQILSGNREPGLPVLKLMAIALQCTTDDLLKRKSQVSGNNAAAG